MFVGPLIQFHLHRVWLHLDTNSEIYQNPNVAIVSIHVLIVPYYEQMMLACIYSRKPAVHQANFAKT